MMDWDNSDVHVDEQAAYHTSDEEVAEAAASELEAPVIQRTQSQVDKQQKVSRILDQLAGRSELVKDLNSISFDSSLLDQQDLQSALTQVSEAQKQARNLGEDLMEDMLALDSLSNLTSEDRTSRKKAIAGIDALLSDLDTAKVKLNNFRKEIEKKVSEQMSENTSPNTLPHRTEVPKTPDRPVKKAARMTEQPHHKARMTEESPRTAASARRHMSKQNLVTMPEVPERELWEQLELPVNFRLHGAPMHEQRRCYVVEADMPYLDMKDVHLRLSPDKSKLIVEGVCLPNPAETYKMQRVVAAQLERLAQMSPEKFANFGASAFATDAFIRIGQGHFGSFSQAFSIPDDVAIANIEASHDNGKLIVVLPKREPEFAHMMPSAYRPYGLANPFHQMGMPMHSTANPFATSNPFHRMGMSAF